MLHQPDDVAKPIVFDPCRPIHYVVNLDGAPSDGLAIIQDAIATVASRDGFKFVDHGPTTEAPSKQRVPYQPETFSRKRWAPVLIAWSDEQASPDLAGYIVGVGGPQPVYPTKGPAVYITGQVLLDRVELSESAVPDRGAVRAVVLHELGHLVGLDHVVDRTQLMFSEAEFAVRDYGAGDLRGLVLVGNGACVPGV